MKIRRNRLIAAAFAIAAAIACAPSAVADTSTISASGTWGNNAPTTAYSEAGATWSFSFDLPDPIASNPSTQLTNFAYYLDGSLVSTTLPGGVLFYPVSQGGGFDLFTDGQTGDNVVSLYFPFDIGSNLTIVDGTYTDVGIGLNDGDPAGTGTVNVTPEPPSILLLGTALFIAGGLVYWKRRDVAFVTSR